MTGALYLLLTKEFGSPVCSLETVEMKMRNIKR